MIEKNIKLQEIQNQLSSNLGVINSDLLVAQNQMTQFYIKALGVIVGGVIVLGAVYYVSGVTFSLKAIIPKAMHDLLQDDTFLFQTQKIYNYSDSATKSEWLIKILNEKKVNLLVKPENSPDFINICDFINSLKSSSSGNGSLGADAVSVVSEVLPPVFDLLASPTITNLTTSTEVVTRLLNVI